MKKFDFGLAWALCLGLALSACARDRDAEDYRREKLAEEMAEINRIAGSYRGTLARRMSGELLGSLQIELRAGTRVGERRDGFESTEYPELRGQVVFEDASGISTNDFQDASYDRVTGAFRATVKIQLRPSLMMEVNFQGVIRDGQLYGTAEANRSIETAGEFTLSKDGARAGLSSLVRKKCADGGSNPLDYEVFYGIGDLWDGKRDGIRMGLDARTGRAELELLNRLMPSKLVQAVIYLGAGIDDERAPPFVFRDAEWDVRYSRLLGKYVHGSRGVELTLDCLWTASERAFQCEISNSLRGVVARVKLEGVAREGECR